MARFEVSGMTGMRSPPSAAFRYWQTEQEVYVVLKAYLKKRAAEAKILRPFSSLLKVNVAISEFAKAVSFLISVSLKLFVLLAAR
jgi:hypothetical protein